MARATSNQLEPPTDTDWCWNSRMISQQAIAPRRMLLFPARAAVASILFALMLGPAGMRSAWASEEAAIAQDNPAFELFREVYDTVHQRNVSPPDDAKLIE